MNEEFWSNLYGWLKCDIGCSLAEIDAMTLHDIRMFSDYAKKNPPLRQLVQAVAAALGVEFTDPQKQEQAPRMTLEQARGFTAAANAAMRAQNG